MILIITFTETSQEKKITVYLFHYLQYTIKIPDVLVKNIE